MAIDRKDYNIPIGKGTHLKRHKDKINAFLFRIQNGGKEKQHAFTIPLRPAWNENEYIRIALARAKEYENEFKKLFSVGYALNSSILLKNLFEIFIKTNYNIKDLNEQHKGHIRNLISIFNNHILEPLGNIHLDELTLYKVQEFYNEMKNKGLEPKTYNRAIKEVLSPMIKYAVKNKWINENVTLGLKLDRVQNKKLVTNPKGKYEAILNAILELYKDNLLYKALFLLIHSGRRRDEVLSLLWQNVDLERKTIFLPKTKNGEAQEHALDDECYNALKALKDEVKQDKGLVFVSSVSGKKISNLARQEAKIRKLSGVKEWTPHFSRHIKASFLMQNGVNPAVISGALGHRDLSTINIYATNDTLKASQRANEALKKLQEKD
ncbi:tyrosine-type recombinase/integrase [Campylobacter jejuni]|uniref:tyrosine-type recombinase/integrase n=1 Tax=Campylobacter jejuni TaxID=197 RepID=UPI003B9C28AA